jgi:hypothetical protein
VGLDLGDFRLRIHRQRRKGRQHRAVFKMFNGRRNPWPVSPS